MALKTFRPTSPGMRHLVLVDRGQLWKGAPIKTLYDFTFALREKKPGDRVDVVVLRDGKEVKVSVELTTRP